MNEKYIIVSNLLAFSLISYCLFWILFDGQISVSMPLIGGSIGLIVSLFALLHSTAKSTFSEALAISGIISCIMTFVFWSLFFGRHPYMREIPSMSLILLSVLFCKKGLREGNTNLLTLSIIISESALAFTFGWWGGREFEGKSRITLTIVLLLCLLLWLFLYRISNDSLKGQLRKKERWAASLISLSFGIMASKYDIERRAPWVENKVFDLHLGSQILLPIIISWLISTSLVLLFLSKTDKINNLE